MRMGFRLTVGVGARTKAWVSATPTGVNKKTATLPNGVRISDSSIAEWLEQALLEALQKLGGEDGAK